MMEVDIPTDVNPKKRNSMENLCNGNAMNGNSDGNEDVDMNDTETRKQWAHIWTSRIITLEQEICMNIYMEESDSCKASVHSM